MRLVSKLLIMLLLVSTLCSCSWIARETGIIDPREEQKSLYGAYYISKWPTAKLSSICDAGSYKIIASNIIAIGPWIAIPLPVIPNPLWPFQYSAYKKRPADMTFTIEAKAKEHDWNNAHIEMIVNGQPLPEQNILDESTEWLIKRQYNYHIGMTCKEFENSEITVKISGIPNTIESHLKYTHRWVIRADGI